MFCFFPLDIQNPTSCIFAARYKNNWAEYCTCIADGGINFKFKFELRFNWSELQLQKSHNIKQALKSNLVEFQVIITTKLQVNFTVRPTVVKLSTGSEHVKSSESICQPCALPSLKENSSNLVLNSMQQSLFRRYVPILYWTLNVCTSLWRVPASLLEECQFDWQV